MDDSTPQPAPFGVVILPSFNSGPKLLETLAAARRVWQPVWVVIDGSTDGSDGLIADFSETAGGVEVIQRATNGGKGEAVLAALRRAQAAKITRALVMDADGQHPAKAIESFFDLARGNPDAVILGYPIFGDDAPALRVHGRRFGNFFTRLNTAGANVVDSLFGFRVYPVSETVAVMDKIRTARRYDFDTEMVIRLVWAGFRPLNRPVPVRYFSAAEGGSSYFRYFRDNALLVRTHLRLFFGMLARLPRLLAQNRRERGS